MRSLSLLSAPRHRGSEGDQCRGLKPSQALVDVVALDLDTSVAHQNLAERNVLGFFTENENRGQELIVTELREIFGHDASVKKSWLQGRNSKNRKRVPGPDRCERSGRSWCLAGTDSRARS